MARACASYPCSSGIIPSWVAQMPLTWLSGSIAEQFTGRHEHVVPLTSVSSDEVLKRVILYWYINIQSQDSAVLATWTSYGVLSLIQWTEGDPPATPEEIGDGDYDARDIVDSELVTAGWGGVFSNQYRAPEQGWIGHLDTNVQRKPAPDAGIVWWCWGLPTFTGAGVEVGYEKAWWRVLIEQPA